MKTIRKTEKLIIGRREHVSFPDLGIFNIEGKIDTGAYTTALHCRNIHVMVEKGKRKLCFKPLGLNEKGEKPTDCCFSEFTTKDIKNSFGETETRYVIKTRLRIGRRSIKAFISLTDRGNMKYPVLIGRRILKNRFMVDVSELFIMDKKEPKAKQNPK